MRVVAQKLEILKFVVLYFLLGVEVNLEKRERLRGPFDLLQQRVDVILVDVSVSQHVDKLPRFEPRHFGDPASQERVACYVEGDAKPNVAASLVKQATQRFVRDIKLEQNVTGWQGHERNVLYVPGANDHSSTIRVFFYHFDHLGYLVYSLALVIVMHAFILCPRVSPLEAIDRPKVTLLSVRKVVLIQKFSAPVSVPNMHAFAG